MFTPRRALLLIAPLLLSGCKDAPTMPLALQQLAGGEEWVAVSAPRGLPSLETWLPYLDRSSTEGREALALVQQLSRQADNARSDGRLAFALALEREAERIALLSLSRNPEARELQAALYALAYWSDRVQAEVALERTPELAAALAEVTTHRAHAVSLLASGDTTSAVLYLSQAAERIRAFTPTEVALRVLNRVEERLRAEKTRTSGIDRALHMLATSRQELLTGDPRRALRRALYALQLAHGQEVASPAPQACLGPGC